MKNPELIYLMVKKDKVLFLRDQQQIYLIDMQ